MKNATELLIIYRVGEIIGLISIIVCVNYLLKKLNSKLCNIDFV
jgi:flagellar biogenesis protein FliO